jgi:hypothetical protein
MDSDRRQPYQEDWQKHRRTRIAFVTLTYLTAHAVGCSTGASRASIIDKYNAAVCVPFSSAPSVSPHTREWDTVLSLRDGRRAVVIGAQVPGGRVSVRYPPTHREIVAADPGDYIYPSDIRLDASGDLLYVKAYGLAGGITEETWLFEYDLHHERILDRRQIKSGVLPPECPETGAVIH